MQSKSLEYSICHSKHDAQEKMQYLIISSLEVTVQSLTVSLEYESVKPLDDWDVSYRIESLYNNQENFQHWTVAALNTINNNVPYGKCDVLFPTSGPCKLILSLPNLLLQSARA